MFINPEGKAKQGHTLQCASVPAETLLNVSHKEDEMKASGFALPACWRSGLVAGTEKPSVESETVIFLSFFQTPSWIAECFWRGFGDSWGPPSAPALKQPPAGENTIYPDLQRHQINRARRGELLIPFSPLKVMISRLFPFFSGWCLSGTAWWACGACTNKKQIIWGKPAVLQLGATLTYNIILI